MQPLPSAFRVHGCRDSLAASAPGQEVCECLGSIAGRLDTGKGISDSDAELFFRLRRGMPEHARAFVIGNAFGFSTILLGVLFSSGGGSVDAIDAEMEGGCNKMGSYVTRRIALANHLDVKLTNGFSPHDVPAAMRFAQYDLAFIDGQHTVPQLLADFAAVEPYMAEKAFIVLHDVGYCDLWAAVGDLPLSWGRKLIRGVRYKNLLGTVLLHRGFPAGYFEDY